MQKEKKSDHRICALTGEKKTKQEMIRFVVSPDNQLVPDLREKLPGRGLWITATQESVAQAISKRVFERGFRQKLTINQDIADNVADLLAKAAIGRLKMANKAGEAVYGFTKLMAAIEKGTIIALFHANGQQGQSLNKLIKKIEKSGGEQKLVKELGLDQPVACFSAEQLSLAFGAANVIHAGLMHGGAAIAALMATRKFIAYTQEGCEGD